MPYYTNPPPSRYAQYNALYDLPTFVNVECECPDGDADHTLAVVEELDGLRVEGKVPKMLIVEEVYSVFVQLEGESLEERDVVGKNLLIGKIQLENDDRIDVIV